MRDITIEYPVVVNGGATLGFAATEGDAEAVAAYHYNRSTFSFELKALPETRSANGFTFFKAWQNIQ